MGSGLNFLDAGFGAWGVGFGTSNLEGSGVLFSLC